MLTRTFISDPAGYDALALEFEDIVNMAEEIVQFRATSPESWLGSCFELGIANPLYLVASRCRETDIKGKAIELLRIATVQEELGVHGPSSEIAGWIRELDQEGVLPSADDVFGGMGSMPVRKAISIRS
jgi:hypothetical protein